MSSAIQCLLHTPLLSEYMISGRYREDINVANRLGYGGAVAEEVANLMYQMWLGRHRSITPQSLKRCINVSKPLFAGYEQQDSQEFLVELLDALHEDLNVNAGRPQTQTPVPVPPDTERTSLDIAIAETSVEIGGVSAGEDGGKTGEILHTNSEHPHPQECMRKRTYSVLGPALEDDVATNLSTAELAAYYWDRHKSRNSSVITRLVQGQLRSEIQCPVCSQTSRTFDPFSCISVPLPKEQAERKIPVTVFRRIPWLFKATAEYRRMIAAGDISLEDLVTAYVTMHR